MDDILAKKNRHLFLEEKDNQNNSFIGNVNTLVNDLENVDTVADNITDVKLTGESIESVNTVAANIEDINNASTNIDTVKTFNDNVNNGTMQYLLEAFTTSLNDQGNAWEVRLTQLGESILATTSAFNYSTVVTVSSDIPANGTLTLPNSMKYKVGTHMLMVSWNGTVCYAGEQYEEVGAYGVWATSIKLNQPAKAGDKIQLRIVALTDQSSYVDITEAAINASQFIASGSNTERYLPEFLGDVVNVKNFGAVGNGVNDDTTAFQSAIASGKAVFVPEGTYKLNTDLNGVFCGVGNSIFTGGTVNSSTILRGIAYKNSDIINVKDYGAIGDGITNETAIFNSIEQIFQDQRINLCGLTFVVDSRPCENYYYNGYFKLNGLTWPAYETPGTQLLASMRPFDFDSYGDENNYLQYILINGVKPSDVGNSYGPTGISHLKGVTAIGYDCLKKPIENNVYLLDEVAIGNNVMNSDSMTGNAEHNIGIGACALASLTTGHRNLAIGSLALFGTTTGYQNVSIGRDSSQSIVSGNNNVVIGYRALGARATIGFDGPIKNDIQRSISEVVAIGNHALINLGEAGGYNIVAIGYGAGANTKAPKRSVFIGHNCCSNINKNGVSFYGKNLTEVEHTATYSASGSNITVTKTGHSAVVGRYVEFLPTSGVLTEKTNESHLLTVASVSGDTFTLTHDMGEFTGSGNCIIYSYEQSATNNNYEQYACTVIGSDSVVNATYIEALTVVGAQTLDNASLGTASYSVLVGDRIGRNVTYCGSSVVVGNVAGVSSGSEFHNVFIGRNAGNAFVGDVDNCYGNTAVGFASMKTLIDGTTSVANVKNSTAIGNNSSVSGSNQVQLGMSGTTTYAYGSVQDRSDARDKADVRNTVLGLDFLLALRPVDFKWDYRDDYIESVEHEVEERGPDGIVEKKIVFETVRHEKDGSKKRNRYHHGLIAQEVKAVLDEKGIDFGGYQDHKVNGGCDILTLGYEEFVAPMIRAIQELNDQLQTSNAKIEALMQRISALENNR